MRANEFTGPDIVNELFQSGQRWEWDFISNDEAKARFVVGGIPYIFYAFSLSDNGSSSWEVEFSIDRRRLSGEDSRKVTSYYGITGTGNSVAVMATVTDILRSFLAEKKGQVTTLTFSASEPSRQALYKRMVTRLLPTWSLGTVSVGDGELIMTANAPR